MMEFNQNERNFLRQLGRREEGRDLVNILKRIKNHYQSIGTLDSKAGDYAGQIEGRKIFAEVIDSVVQEIETKERQVKPKDQDDFT